eukprot:4830474-Amphidinium_carterae.1
MQQLVHYAVRLLGLMSERITEEKGTKQILNHTGPTTKDKPQANATGADTRSPANTKKGKDNPKPPKQVGSLQVLLPGQRLQKGRNVPTLSPS